jgi:hypothetical protein
MLDGLAIFSLTLFLLSCMFAAWFYVCVAAACLVGRWRFLSCVVGAVSRMCCGLPRSPIEIFYGTLSPRASTCPLVSHAVVCMPPYHCVFFLSRVATVRGVSCLLLFLLGFLCSWFLVSSSVGFLVDKSSYTSSSFPFFPIRLALFFLFWPAVTSRTYRGCFPFFCRSLPGSSTVISGASSLLHVRLLSVHGSLHDWRVHVSIVQVLLVSFIVFCRWAVLSSCSYSFFITSWLLPGVPRVLTYLKSLF